ncbi:MAG: Crp/Fnr family transcriptional regulator [Bdellovibrionia bacterium]
MAAELKTFKAGEILFNEGEPSASLFIVKRGAISIRKKKGSSSVEVGKVTTGEVMGELSFFDREPRSASASAIVYSEVLEIKFEELSKIYDTVPDYLKTIMASLANRLRKANETIRQLQKTPTS